MKMNRQREIKTETLTSNTNKYGAILANGSANHNKEYGATLENTETRDQNAENKRQGIAKSKYTFQITFKTSELFSTRM